MSYLSEAHSEWHAIHGRYAVCPLDCGIGDGHFQAEECFCMDMGISMESLAEYETPERFVNELEFSE